jgi:hypothetical protein
MAHHALLYDLGASSCFERHNPNVSLDIGAALAGLQQKAGRQVAVYALDAAGALNPPKSSARLMSEAISASGLIEGTQYNVTFVSVAPQPVNDNNNIRFTMPAAYREREVRFILPGGPRVSPADVQASRRMWQGTRWAIAAYQQPDGFYMPPPSVVDAADDVLASLSKVAKQCTFGKVVIKHPIKASILS